MSLYSVFPLFLIFAYLIGSVSSAVIVCRLMGLPDPRTQGSKNPGATNVMRIGGKKAAYLTFIGDFLKGLVPVLLARWLVDDNVSWAVAGAGLGAFLGHLYPLYFGFKGGKGVATLVGILIAVNLLAILVFAVTWVAVLFITGYVSLASMLGAALAAITAVIFLLPLPIILLLTVLAALVIYRHRSNIENLLNGTENSFKKKKS